MKILTVKTEKIDISGIIEEALAVKECIDGAIYHFSEAIKINPDYPEAHNNLGSALLCKGNFDAAAFHFQNAFPSPGRS